MRIAELRYYIINFPEWIFVERFSQQRCRSKTQIGNGGIRDFAFAAGNYISRISRGLPANDGNGGKPLLLFRTFRYKKYVRVHCDNMFACRLNHNLR